MGCDLEVAIAAWQEDRRALLDDVLTAAACGPRISADQAARLGVGGEPGTGTVDVSVYGLMRVSIDGVAMVGPTEFAAGWHLLQAAPAKGPSEVAEWFHLDAGATTTRVVARTGEDRQLSVYSCDDVDAWIRELRDGAESVNAERATPLVRAGSVAALAACPGVDPDRLWTISLATVEMGARSGHFDVVDVGKAQALTLDPGRYERWVQRQHTTAHIADVGIVAGLAMISGGAGYELGWGIRHDDDSALVPLGLGGWVTSIAASVQAGALIRQGVPVNRAAGTLGIASISAFWPLWSGGGLETGTRFLGVPAGFVQVIENAHAAARARKHAEHPEVPVAPIPMPTDDP